MNSFSPLRNEDYKSNENSSMHFHGPSDDQDITRIQSQIEDMYKFMQRRFDEVSMEVNATSQLVGMAEEEISKRFAEILEILGAISYSGDGSSPVNAGVELEAVIDDTENAANQILDAADRIAKRVQEKYDWDREDSREEALEFIKDDIQEILLACTFQDLTGQRIRKTLENLHLIETRLSATLSRIGISADEIKPAAIPAEALTERKSQDDIDALFAEAREKS